MATGCRRRTCRARKDVYDEGALTFPCVRVQRDFENVEDIIRMCRSRIRVPDQWYGDFLAGLGAARIAERRLEELCAHYGVDVIRDAIREWFDYSERRMDQAIRKLPSGTLHGSSTHDPYPGLPDGIPLKIEVRIDAEDGRVELDLRDNPDNYPGGLNESRACSMANALIGLFNSIDPDIPHNAGSFRRVTVHLREGCIAGIPRFPHSCSMATTNVADRLVCITQAAFAEIGDGYGLAEGGMGMGPHMGVVAGADARLGDRPYVNQMFIGSAGGPGSPTADGWPTYLIPVCASLIYKDSIEVDEQRYPIHVEEQRLLPDTEGAGRFRGGLGCISVYGPTDRPMSVAYSLEARDNPPRGVRGGQSPSRTEVWKVNAAGERVDVPACGRPGAPAGRTDRLCLGRRRRLRRSAHARPRGRPARRARRLGEPRAGARGLRRRADGLGREVDAAQPKRSARQPELAGQIRGRTESPTLGRDADCLDADRPLRRREGDCPSGSIETRFRRYGHRVAVSGIPAATDDSLAGRAAHAHVLIDAAIGQVCGRRDHGQDLGCRDSAEQSWRKSVGSDGACAIASLPIARDRAHCS